eukprot:3710841-Prymnesium_polylepis.1
MKTPTSPRSARRSTTTTTLKSHAGSLPPEKPPVPFSSAQWASPPRAHSPTTLAPHTTPTTLPLHSTHRRPVTHTHTKFTHTSLPFLPMCASRVLPPHTPLPTHTRAASPHDVCLRLAPPAHTHARGLAGGGAPHRSRPATRRGSALPMSPTRGPNSHRIHTEFVAHTTQLHTRGLPTPSFHVPAHASRTHAIWSPFMWAPLGTCADECVRCDT